MNFGKVGAIVCLGLLMTADSGLAVAQEKPDFTGMWLGSTGIRGGAATVDRQSTSWPRPAPLTPAGQAAFEAYDPTVDDPPEDCLPWGLPRGVVFSFYPMLLTMTDNMLLMTLEYEPIPRRIYFDEREYPDDIPPGWFGYSIGHWEGDTLVVDTRNIRVENIITTDGLPQSDQMRVIERFTLLDDGETLEVDVTAIDPAYYTEPMHIQIYWSKSNDVEHQEFICAEGLIENITTSGERQDEVLGD